MLFLRFMALVIGLGMTVSYSLVWLLARYTVGSPRYVFMPMDGGWRQAVGWIERYMET